MKKVRLTLKEYKEIHKIINGTIEIHMDDQEELKKLIPLKERLLKKIIQMEQK